MMKVIFTPVKSDFSVQYQFGDDKVTATMDGKTEVFKFKDMPNGRAGMIRSEKLPFTPVTNAVRKDGLLTVTVTYLYGEDAEDWEKEEREETYSG